MKIINSNEFGELLLKPGAFSEEDIERLRTGAGFQVSGWVPTAQFRAAVELISAVRRFDENNERAQVRLLEAIAHFDATSGTMAGANLELGRQVKRLTGWGVGFAAVGAALAVFGLLIATASLILAYWTYQLALITPIAR